MRGLKDGAVARKPVQHFLMSVVRLKTLFWEIERRKTSLWSSHTARNRSDFKYTPPQQLTSTDVSDRAYALSVSRKGIERVSECPTHILDLVRKPQCGCLKHQSAS
ncbi:hypothetical protein TNIN_6621 [Trichonephila inaurata madagascariensis]|uniref:Uncharacterized protein n=1 Tax=Trichonephila inaurata madagascariensis TaxID=2747483 RepID=A0A8X6IB26_9ARAC|nr:hypothetical protein TNIN_6621 [Trichonephila inaurata madagascariensis]